MKSQIKILIVEDDLFTAKNIGIALKKQEYIVFSANSIDQAKKLLNQITPDAVVMDIDLNGPIDGIDLAALINKSNQVPIIYLTQNDDERVVDKAKIMHHSIFMTKPFNSKILLSNIELALDMGRNLKKDTIPALFVKVKSKKVKIPYDQLAYLMASRAYCEIYRISDNGETEKFEVSKSMNVILNQLPRNQFIKTHRSYVVNLHLVNSITANEVIMEDGTGIPIAEGLRAKVLETFNQV